MKMKPTRKPKAKRCLLCKKLMMIANSESGWCNLLNMQVETKDICHE